MTGKKQFIRSLTLCKHTNQSVPEAEEKFIFGEDASRFFAFGTYDAIVSKEIDIEKALHPLEAVADENKEITEKLLETCNDSSGKREKIRRGEYFEHIRHAYIVYPYNYDQADSDEEIEKRYRTFWDDESTDEYGNKYAYFFVTNIYTKGHKESSKSTCLTSVERILRERSKSGHFIYLVTRPLDTTDITLCLKTNKPMAVKKTLKKLITQGTVGFSHTICTLPKKLLMDESILESGALNKTDKLTIQIEANEWNLALSGICETLKNAGSPNAPMHSMFGVNTIIALYPQVDTRALYAFAMRLLSERWNGQLLSTETKTHIGVADDEFIESKKAVSELHAVCSGLRDKYSGLFLKEKDSDRNQKFFRNQLWWEKLNGLIDLLCNITRTPIFDETAFLLINSITYFYCWLEAAYEKCAGPDSMSDENQRLSIRRQLEDLLDPHKKEIDYFLDSIEQLTDHIIRADGTVSPAKNYDLPKYNMCTGVVEFCGAFYARTAQYYEALSPNGCEERTPAYLILPKLRRRIMVENHLSKSNLSDHLSLMEIPVETVGSPYIICSAIAHEAAHHFSGTRSRDERFWFFIEAITIELMNALYTLEEEAYLFILKELHTVVKIQLQCMENDGDGNGHFMEILKNSVKSGLKAIIYRESFPEALVAHIYKNRNATDDEKAARKAEIKRSIELLNPDLEHWHNSIEKMVEDTNELFRQCYADIMMYHLLDVEFVDYFRALAEDFKAEKSPLPALPLLDKNFRLDGIDHRFCLWLQRIALVWHTCYRNKSTSEVIELAGEKDENEPYERGPSEFNEYEKKVLRYMMSAVKEYEKEYRKFKKLAGSKSGEPVNLFAYHSPGFHPYAYLDRIQEYLNLCFKKAEGAVAASKEKREERELLRGAYKKYAVQGAFYPYEYKKIIEDSRKTMIDQAKKVVRWDYSVEYPFKIRF